MPISIQPRNVPSKTWHVLSPLVALVGRIIVGLVLFSLLGKSAIAALTTLFISPLADLYGLTQIAVKASPILLTAIGESVCFQALVWNWVRLLTINSQQS